MQTYFIVQPYEKTPRNGLRPMEPIPAKDEKHGRRLVAKYAATAAGAILFSRRADFDLGEYEDAIILQMVGEVPDVHAEAA